MILFSHILLSINIIDLYNCNLTYHGYNYAKFVKYITIILVTIIPYRCVVINILLLLLNVLEHNVFNVHFP